MMAQINGSWESEVGICVYVRSLQSIYYYILPSDSKYKSKM